MSTPDLNLLVALDVLLVEESVSRAAVRLRLSDSAMSRTLSRLREVTGDPLLVRAGRRLVPTPRAIELRDQATRLVQDAQSVLRPASKPKLDQLERTFALRTSDGFVENFGPALMTRIAKEAPGVRLRFVQKVDRDPTPLRTGAVDLETGVVQKETAPEFRTQSLFRDRFIGVARREHPLAKGTVTMARYTDARHVSVSRHGLATKPVDDALSALGAQRDIVAVVSGFAAALSLAKDSDLVATVPDLHTYNLRGDLRAFPLPFTTPTLSVALLWHPRFEADVTHRWLRTCVREVCRSASRVTRA